MPQAVQAVTAASSSSLRMTAAKATLGGLPARTRRWWKAARSGFQRAAARAGMYSSRRTLDSPPNCRHLTAPLPVQCRSATFRHAARTKVLLVCGVAPAGVRDLSVWPVRPACIRMEQDHSGIERRRRRTKLLHPFSVNDQPNSQVAT